jgi:hypothetical membrane protein
MRAAQPSHLLSVAVTSRRLALLGLASVGVILAGMVITAIPYRGYDGEAYSPLNHFVSELGEIAASRLAWAFNLGIVLGGVGLGAFLLLLTRRLSGPFRPALTAVGLVAGASGTLVGVFPMDYLMTHRIVSGVFFVSGWIVAGLFTAWLLTTRKPGFPRWLGVPGAAAVAVSLVFIDVYSTYVGADPAGRIVNRPISFWDVPFLEWAALLSLLAWFACVSLALLREPAG